MSHYYTQKYIYTVKRREVKFFFHKVNTKYNGDDVGWSWKEKKSVINDVDSELKFKS